MRAGKLSREILYNMGITDGAVRKTIANDSPYSNWSDVACIF